MYESRDTRWVEGRREKGKREGEEGVRERGSGESGELKEVHLA